jgi:hypothetical protein
MVLSSDFHWLFDLTDRTAVKSHFEKKFSWDESQARQFLEHRLSFFSTYKDFGKCIRWNKDYLNDIEAPLEYGRTLDYRDSIKVGDIKYVWEPSRFHHLVELAKAFYLTGKVEYAEEVVVQVDSWIEQCPYPMGVHWSSSLESAIRMINWCFAVQFILAADKTFFIQREKFWRKWLSVIHQHLTFIRHNFSAYSSANNHLIGEASGLFFGSLCFDFVESKQWTQLSKNILEREALKQNHPDGVNKEQAISYQAFVFDFLTLSALLGEKNGYKFSREYWQRLEKMADFVGAVIEEDGTVPQFGDEDDGRVVILSHEKKSTDFQSLLSTGAALFDRVDFMLKSSNFDEKSFWILGPMGVERYNDASRVASEKISFNEGGYHIIKQKDSRFIFDCGPLGYLSIAAHGHADALSFVMNYKGKKIFVDRGTYTYHTDKAWRDYFRGTAAHNTLRIDGQDQSLIGGNFMWLKKANSRLVSINHSSVHGLHSGYRRLKDPVVHERAIRYDETERQYEIHDKIQAKASHQIEQFFHLDPACDVEVRDGVYSIKRDGAVVTLRMDPKISNVKIYRGSITPVAGWQSPRYALKSPAVTICATFQTQGVTEFVTIIQLD